MKRLAILSALLLSTAGPVLAQSQLERELRVEPGRYSTDELIRLNAATEQTGNDRHVYFDANGTMMSASAIGVNPRAAEIVARLGAASEDGQDRLLAMRHGGATYAPADSSAAHMRVLDIIEANGSRQGGSNS